MTDAPAGGAVRSAAYGLTLFSEHVSFAVLAREDMGRVLGGVSPLLHVALRPAEVDAFARVVPAIAAHGCRIGIWPQLDDAQGRWASSGNARAFAEHARGLRDRLRSVVSPVEWLIDLEPPIARVRAWLGRPQWTSSQRMRSASERPSFDSSRSIFRDLVAELRSEGASVAAAVLPMTAYDEGEAWQRLLGTPVDGVPYDRIVVMAYSSLFEGYGRGLFDRRDARRWLADVTRRAHRRWGARTSIGLGVTGGGAIGDERAYRGWDELAEDAAIVRNCGVCSLALYGVDGMADATAAAQWLASLDGAHAMPLDPRRWRGTLVERIFELPPRLHAATGRAKIRISGAIARSGKRRAR